MLPWQPTRKRTRRPSKPLLMSYSSQLGFSWFCWHFARVVVPTSARYCYCGSWFCLLVVRFHCCVRVTLSHPNRSVCSSTIPLPVFPTPSSDYALMIIHVQLPLGRTIAREAKKTKRSFYSRYVYRGYLRLQLYVHHFLTFTFSDQPLRQIRSFGLSDKEDMQIIEPVQVWQNKYNS